jgi:hypothetical protein
MVNKNGISVRFDTLVDRGGSRATASHEITLEIKD